MESFSETVNKIDFESLATQLSTIDSLDLHLQHLLIDKDSLKIHQERVKKVDDTVVNLESHLVQLQNQVTQLLSRPQQQECTEALSDVMREHQDRARKSDQTVLSLDSQMNQLREQVSELVHRPQLVQPSLSSVTDELVANISDKLDQICA